MSTSVKVSVGLVAAAVLVLVVALLATRGSDPTPPSAGADAADGLTAPLVREDSPRLSTGSDAVFVEFLDFECEGCLAAYPVIEDLRERYGDRVTFVVRHLPLHGNSVAAALAAEAAAEQGEFEAMYQRLFETAESWGHQRTSQEATFLGYAEDLGLDLAQYRADVDDPTLLDRVEQGQRDAETLGLTGTPTFFLDGERLDVASQTDLEEAFDAVLD